VDVVTELSQLFAVQFAAKVSGEALCLEWPSIYGIIARNRDEVGLSD